jgi:uncharacterized protein HemY
MAAANTHLRDTIASLKQAAESWALIAKQWEALERPEKANAAMRESMRLHAELTRLVTRL